MDCVFSINQTRKNHICCMHLKIRTIQKPCIGKQHNGNCTTFPLSSIQPNWQIWFKKIIFRQSINHWQKNILDDQFATILLFWLTPEWWNTVHVGCVIDFITIRFPKLFLFSTGKIKFTKEIKKGLEQKNLIWPQTVSSFVGKNWCLSWNLLLL